jgi:hypothetical protein
MDHGTNTIQNKTLASLMARAPQGVVNAIQQASAKTGVNFAYLVQQAGAESSFNPKIKAKTSSASGLYQFIESTWLNMVKKHGDKYGMGELADKINANGKVANKADRKEILALRNDPEIASLMAAEFAQENGEYLDAKWGGKVGSTELYFAHFLGAGQAAAFLRERDENPLQSAAVLFPAAAKANKNVFYDSRTGRAKSMNEVYAFFDNKFSIEDVTNATYQYAEAAPVPPPKPDLTAEMKSALGIDEKPGAIGSLEQLIASNVFVDRVNHTNEFYYGGNNGGGTPSRPHYNSLAYQNLTTNPVEIMLLSQLEMPTRAANPYKLND